MRIKALHNTLQPTLLILQRMLSQRDDAIQEMLRYKEQSAAAEVPAEATAQQAEAPSVEEL